MAYNIEVKMVQDWQDALRRAARQAIEVGHLRPDADAEQLVYEMYGLILALHHDARFLRNAGAVERARRGFERLVENYRNPNPPQGTPAQ